MRFIAFRSCGTISGGGQFRYERIYYAFAQYANNDEKIHNIDNVFGVFFQSLHIVGGVRKTSSTAKIVAHCLVRL
jgi:hypothetical protein